MLTLIGWVVTKGALFERVDEVLTVCYLLLGSRIFDNIMLTKSTTGEIVNMLLTLCCKREPR